MPRPINDLIRLAVAGGSIELDARTRPADDLVRLAVAAANSKARSLVLKGTESRSIIDLVRIAVAGDGKVIFRGE